MRGGLLTVLALPPDLRSSVPVLTASLLLSPTSLGGGSSAIPVIPDFCALFFRMRTTAYPSWTVKPPCSQSTMDTEVIASTVLSGVLQCGFSRLLSGCWGKHLSSIRILLLLGKHFL